MGGCCKSTGAFGLLRDPEHSALRGEDFVLSVAAQGATDALLQVRARPDTSAPVLVTGTFVLGAEAVEFTVPTATLAAGTAYYFDAFACDAEGRWRTILRRQGLVVIQGVTTLPPGP